MSYVGTHYAYLGRRTGVYGIVGLVSCITGIGVAWLLQDVLHSRVLAVVVYVRDLIVQRQEYCMVQHRRVSSRTLHDRLVMSMVSCLRIDKLKKEGYLICVI